MTQDASHSRRSDLPAVLGVVLLCVVGGSIAASAFMGADGARMNDPTRTQVGMFSDAAEMFRFQVGRFPESLEELIKAPREEPAASRWRGPYLVKDEIPLDQWGNEYRYAAPGEHNPNDYDVWSVGPDGLNNTSDDVGNW